MNICTDIHDPDMVNPPDFADPVTRINIKLALNMHVWMIKDNNFIDPYHQKYVKVELLETGCLPLHC